MFLGPRAGQSQALIGAGAEKINLKLEPRKNGSATHHCLKVKFYCDFQPGDVLFEYAGELITGKYSYTFNLDQDPGVWANLDPDP